MAWQPRYDAEDVKEAVASSASVAEALAKLGLRSAGHNARTLRRLTDHYGIDTEHLRAGRIRRTPPPRQATPLTEILVEGSTYHRGHLKERLYQ
jgi:hypothetical protein